VRRLRYKEALFHLKSPKLDRRFSGSKCKAKRLSGRLFASGLCGRQHGQITCLATSRFCLPSGLATDLDRSV
jgi:hypothetical protein